ncbi:MAG: hypothetical protein P8H37_08740, partial [Paracoccaceae bacterium]|nr:hypothetical protein [Paracoccaceae bacterium]
MWRWSGGVDQWPTQPHSCRTRHRRAQSDLAPWCGGCGWKNRLGAGIHIDIPVGFFQDQIRRTGHEPRGDELLAVGQVFLPRHDFGAQETCRTIVETEVLRMGYYIFGWRHVPVDVECLGEKANATRPEIEQILISNSKGVDKQTFERELYVIRRRIEKAAANASVQGLYIASLSCRSIIYKGMML